jgi:hypothetical protein
MNKFFLSFLLFSMFAIASIQAQGERAPSPSAKLVQKVGLTDITIEYSRPSVKGRTIFAADGLVPFGKKWRTGANSATKITFSDAVTIGDVELAAGSYAILTTPGADSWDIHFFPYDGTRWTPYSEATPSVTIKAMAKTLPNNVESFLITIDDLKDYSASIILRWEKTAVSFPIKVK